MPLNRIERYRNSEVMTADPAVLVRLLLEETIRTVRTAIDHCREGRVVERGQSASRAVELLTALMVNLNADDSPDLTGSLSRLYEFCQYRVIEGHIRGEVKAFESVLPVLADITEAWVAVLEKERIAGEADAETAGAEEVAEPAWA